jgi:alcohol dehydrogenase, propanol-preferring
MTDGLGAHTAVVTAASSAGFIQAIDYRRPGGTLMAFGMPGKENLNVSIFTVFGEQEPSGRRRGSSNCGF